MSKKENVNLGFLGYNFQIKLLKQLIEDHQFSESIIDSIDPQYFDNEYLRLIVASIKNYYEKYEVIPTYEAIRQLIKLNVKREIPKESAMALIKEIDEIDYKDWKHIQETTTVFVKQQELKRGLNKINKILDSGQFDRYDEIENILKGALEIGDNEDNAIDVFHAIDDVLAEDFRDPIPTGIVGIDNLMGGGLSKGELGVILAPFGVGKTTIVSKMANHAYNMGHNVIQIFFEDKKQVIQRKHFACWTGIQLSEISQRGEEIKEKIQPFIGKKNFLSLKKFPGHGTTIARIKQFLKKEISKGNKPDIIFLDYIDCVESEKSYKDDYSAEGPIMRQFETMLDELDIAGWTAIQGNRSSIGANVVEADMIGGSIKKGQIGHFILSIAKTLEQKEEARATLAVLKSRFGKDGVIFEDILFDNGTLQIDTENSNDVSFLDFEKSEDSRRSQMVQNAIAKRDEHLKNRKQ